MAGQCFEASQTRQQSGFFTHWIDNTQTVLPSDPHSNFHSYPHYQKKNTRNYAPLDAATVQCNTLIYILYCILMSNSSAMKTWLAIDFLDLFWYIRARSASKASSSMKRKDIKAAIQQRGGIEAALIVPKGTLTTRQRRFAEAVAAGETGAAAYRSAYNTKASAHSQSNDATRLKRHPVISQQIEALKLANEAMAYASATQVRQLVIQSLIQTLIDPDTKAATKVSAAKVLGSVTEVAAFTDRKEITHIKDSSAIRDQIMAQLRSVITSDAQDVDADTLLGEIAGEKPVKSNASADDRTLGGDAILANEPHPRTLHSNPHEQSLENSDPPSSFDIDEGEGDISDEIAFMALNAETPPLGDETDEGGGDILDKKQ